MNNYKNSCISIIIILLLMTSVFSLYGERPKVFKTGLALSGGGAKGLAHIGLLELIDSLDIQIDYITGTSMGSIVGGLYAAGYSGDSINKIVHEIDWNYILSNKIPLNKVHITEKKSYGKSMAALPIKKVMPLLPDALIEGQYLSDELSRYFFHTRNINDFSKLPIPLKVVATDILTGATVRLKEGSLPVSIRASMAIPAVFTSVYLGDYLLVDGGMTRNFPVEEVKEMGADFVIGSYTGMRIRSKDEVENPLNTLTQTFAFNAVADAKKQKSLTDIELDFSESLIGIETQSFNDYDKIIKKGKEKAYEILPQLIELKKKQEAANIRKTRNNISLKSKTIQNINTYTQNQKPLSLAENKTLTTFLEENGKQKLDDYNYLLQKISKIYSLGFYSKIYYTFSNNNDSTKDLNIFVKPIEKELKVSLHFDTYESAGIIFKFNQNSLWLPNSKFSFAADLSAYPKIDISYLKFLNNNLNVWGKIEYNRKVQTYNDIYFKLISQALYHTKSNLRNTNQEVSLSLGYSPTINSALCVSTTYLFDKINKESGILSDLFYIEDQTSDYLPMYNHEQIGLGVNYQINTLNSSFYPTSGLKLNANLGWLHNLNYSFHIPPESDELGRVFYEIINPEVDQHKVYNDVFQADINIHWALPLSDKLSLQTYMFGGMNFINKDKKLSFAKYEDYLFVSQKYTIGGYNNYDYNHQVPFAGFGINEIYNNGEFTLTGALQWNVWRKLYITPRISVGQILNNPNPFNKNNSEKWLWGAGMDVDYLTPLGPIKIGFGINNKIDILVGILSLGYQF